MKTAKKTCIPSLRHCNGRGLVCLNGKRIYLIEKNKPVYPEAYFYMRASAGSSIGQIVNNYSNAPDRLTQHLPHKDIPIHFGTIGTGSPSKAH